MGIRLLKPSEIECRVQTINKTGCSLLLYKDARVDMKLLDETFGQNNWRRTHEEIAGNLYCNIDIWDDEKKQWVRKQDVGVESQQSSEKGQASDAFKRAGFNVGIGRELYTSPFIWVALGEGETYERNNKTQLSYKVKLSVGTIEYDDDRNITNLTIVDQDGSVRFKMGKYTPPQGKAKPEKQSNKEVRKETNEAFEKLKAEKLQALEAVKKSKDVESLEEVWLAFDNFWNDKGFIKLVKDKKEELLKK